MTAPNLVHMVNQIGQFFESMPEPALAQQELTQHLRQFWAPSMRQSLLAHLDTGQAPHASTFVTNAIAQHRSGL